MLADEDGIVGYLRLSREEEKERGVSMEEKLALRRQILLAIARHHDLPLREENIVTEVKSGGSLSERPGLLALLDRCRSREIHTVVCFDVDRLTRDVADLKTITSAFFKGEVTLITQRGVYRFDRHFDTTLLQILAVLGEKERRSFSYRRKAANEQRTRSGQLSQGYAPYGYRWDADARCYRIAPTEYAVLTEIFRRIWAEGAHTLAKDLTRRGIPPPGQGKRADSCALWLPGTIHNMARNPFYTGCQVKRCDVDREGVNQSLPKAQWVWSEEPLATQDEAGNVVPLPHPLPRAEWEALGELLHSRQAGTPTKGLLSGLLHCHQGGKMHKRHKHYACGCRERGAAHRAWNVVCGPIEAAVWRTVAEHLSDLFQQPDSPTGRASRSRPLRRERDTGGLELERAAAQRHLREKRQTMEELVRRAAWYHQLPGYGPERHAQALESLGREVEGLEARLAQIAAQLERPELRRNSPLLEEVKRQGGVESFLATAAPATTRALLRLLARRVELLPPPKTFIRAIRVTFYALDGRGELSRCVDIPHPRAGKKRGPYQRRNAGDAPADGN